MLKLCLAVIISTVLTATWIPNTHASVKSPNTLLILGDSLSAAYGMNYSQGWVSLLEKRLANNNIHWNIVNASISGETSKGALNRLPKLIETHQPRLLLIELGANDGLRGYPLPQLKSNLEKLIAMGKNNGATVVLMEMKIPPNYGKRYVQEFIGIYHDVAEQQELELIPFFIEGVAEDEQLMQSDNIHPNEKAQPLLLEVVWLSLQKIIKGGGVKTNG